MILLGDAESHRVPSLQVSQLYSQYAGLNGVEATGVPDTSMLVLLGTSVVSQFVDGLGDLFGVGNDGPGISNSPKILTWVEAEAAHIPKGAYRSAFVSCSMGLSRIFDNVEAVTSSHG